MKKKKKPELPLIVDFNITVQSDSLFNKNETVRRRVYKRKDGRYYIKYKGWLLLLQKMPEPMFIMCYEVK